MAPSVSVDAWVQTADVYGLLYPSVKTSGMINVDVFCDL